MRKFKEKYIGDRAFYKTVLLMVVPMILQSLVTNLVSMIDNVMVGQIGTNFPEIGKVCRKANVKTISLHNKRTQHETAVPFSYLMFYHPFEQLFKDNFV